MILELPWPPSANRYYRVVKGRPILSKLAREYRASVCSLLHPSAPVLGRLIVQIEACPPDRRRRDIDNCLKQLLDALQHAGLYQDDSQIDEILIRRGIVVPAGLVRVEVQTSR